MTTHINLHPSPAFPLNPIAGQTGQILYGVKRIARHLQMTPRQVAYAVERGRLPIFRLGAIICTTPTLLEDHFRKLANVSHSGQSGTVGGD